ncbi:MAG: NTP transferase domain-containing protein [Candidatus Thorarchaeota archaeon]
MVLAAGKGERMHPLTKEVPKALINIGGKTLVDRTIDRLNRAGIEKIVVAVGWKGSLIEDHLTSSSDFEGSIVYVENYEIGPLQTLVTAIETFDDDFLLTPVDMLIDTSVISGLLSHYSTSVEPRRMTLAVDFDATSGTLVSKTEDGVITGLGSGASDTDTIGRSAMLFIGDSHFGQECRTALAAGETKLVSLLSQMIHKGHSLRSYSVDSHSIDIDTLQDILSANRFVLQRGEFSQSGQVFVPDGDSVEIGDSLTLNSNITLQRGTELIGPVLISQGCDIGENCRIGPNSTIGSSSSVLTGCEISDSIVFGKSIISAQSQLQGTIIYNSKQYNME